MFLPHDPDHFSARQSETIFTRGPCAHIDASRFFQPKASNHSSLYIQNQNFIAIQLSVGIRYSNHAGSRYGSEHYTTIFTIVSGDNYKYFLSFTIFYLSDLLSPFSDDEMIGKDLEP